MSDSGTALAQILRQELAELGQFRELLARESALLQSTDIEALPEITSAKAVLASRLGELLQRREALLARLGLGSGQSGMQAWLATRADAEQKLDGERWTRLLQLGDECRREHALNGQLIALRMAQNQKALTALLSAAGQPLTYGPDGQQRIGPGSGRTLGSA